MTHHRKKAGRLAPGILAGALAYGLSMSTAAGATLLLAGLPKTARPMPDSALATLCGRYVNGNDITYFGLEMSSQWANSSGSSMTVGTNIDLNLDKAHPLSISSYATRNGNTVGADTSTGGAKIEGLPLAHLSGVGQSIQIVGSDNTVHNVASVDVATGPGNGATPNSGAPDNLIADGPAVGTVRVTNNSVDLSIDVPGRVAITQSLNTQGLMQNAQVLSNANTILNRMTLTVGLKAASGLSVGSLSQLLASLHGVQ